MEARELSKLEKRLQKEYKISKAKAPKTREELNEWLKLYILDVIRVEKNRGNKHATIVYAPEIKDSVIEAVKEFGYECKADHDYWISRCTFTWD